MKQNNQNVDLTSGNIWRSMLRFALPIFWGSLFQSLYTIVDAIIIGQFAGKNALAAIESILGLTRLPVNFFIGLSSGAMIIIAQYYGAKKYKSVATASHNAILFSLVGGLVLSLSGVTIAPLAVKWIRVPQEIIGSAQLYLMIFYAAMLASLLYNVAAAILRAVGNSKVPFHILIVTNIVNLLLDLLFVAYFKMGVLGAAYATAIATFLSALLIVAFLFKTDLPCKLHINQLKFYKAHLLQIVKLGMPIGMQSIFYQVANAIVQSSINSFGVASIAAWAVAGKLDFLIWNTSGAMAVAVSTFVAQNFGARQSYRAKVGVRTGLAMAITLILLFSGILYLWSPVLARLLIADNEVIVLTQAIIRFLAPLYFMYAIITILPAAIRGTGEAFKPMIVDFLGICLFRIFWIAFILPQQPSLLWALAVFPASWIFTSLMFIVMYIYRINKYDQQFNISSDL